MHDQVRSVQTHHQRVGNERLDEGDDAEVHAEQDHHGSDDIAPGELRMPTPGGRHDPRRLLQALAHAHDNHSQERLGESQAAHQGGDPAHDALRAEQERGEAGDDESKGLHPGACRNLGVVITGSLALGSPVSRGLSPT
jgi:hypothetical protein